jgi:hypothetical protein
MDRLKRFIKNIKLYVSREEKLNTVVPVNIKNVRSVRSVKSVRSIRKT